MDIFDGLHPQCADSIDVEKSDSSEDSDMEVIEQLVDPAEAKLKGQGLSAKDRRVLVTRIVAKAHSLTISAGNAKRHEVFKKMGYLPADPSDIKLRVLPSYTFVPMSEVEQHVQQMVAPRAQVVPEPDPVCNLPAAKRQATITSYFRT